MGTVGAKLWRVQLVMVAVLIVLASIFGLGLFSGTWNGGWGDITTVLAWALALDLASGGLIGLLAARKTG